jgi:pyruvate dehydrogenase (quinone)
VTAGFAFPEGPLVCTIGDGAFQMLGMNELITIKRQWRTWTSPTFVVLILHNGDLDQVSSEMRAAGDARFDTSQLLDDVDDAGYADRLGLEGNGVEDPDSVENAWDRAFSSDRPVVLDVITNKNIPPLRAHVTSDQVIGVAKALLRRDPDAGAVAEHSLRATTAQWFARPGG